MPLTWEGFGFGTDMYMTSSYITLGIPDYGVWNSGIFYTRLAPYENLGILRDYG